MMKQLQAALENYLVRIERFGELGLGGTDDQVERPITDDDSRCLATALDQKLKFNKYVVVVILAALGLLFLIASSFLLYHRQDVRAVYGTFAFLLLSNLGIIRWLRQLWWEANVMDASLYVLRKLPPEQAATFISRLYWDFLQSSFSRTRRPPREPHD
jgi:hypothetical protein